MTPLTHVAEPFQGTGESPSHQRGEAPPRAPSAERRWYASCLGALAAVYVALYGWLLVSTAYLPYVYDNTETFSALVHAQNLYQFDLFTSWGLTDEAYGPNPAAHPFVHSHQGNFPRLFAFLLLVLGARTAESQIVVTTFTIGALAVFLAFEFLARRAGPRFALLACLLFLTDYLFFAQWQVVTYRVWHVFFVFSSLLCVDGIGGGRRRLWTALTFANFLSLFYYELIFVAYVAIFSALYAGWQYRWRLRTALRFWGVQAAGGGLALLVLMLQGALFLGLRVFAEDLYLTYFARNLGGNDPALLERLDTFFRAHPIVFWFNLIDVRGMRTLPAYVGQLATWHFEALTPFLTLALGIVAVGWLLGAIPWRAPRVHGGRRPPGAPGSAWLLRDRWRTPAGLVRLSLRIDTPVSWPGWLHGARAEVVRMAAVVALIGIPALLLAVTLVRDQAHLGLPQSQLSFLRQTRGLGYLWLMGAALLSVALAWAALPSWRAVARISPGRALLVGALLLGVSGFVRGQSALYNQDAAPLWLSYLGLGLPHWASALTVAIASVLAAALALLGNRRVLGDSLSQHLGGLTAYVTLGAVALYVTYLLAPGYVISGYLSRGAPLFVFLVDVVLAIGLYVPLAAAGRALMGAAQVTRSDYGLGWRRPVAAAALVGMSVALVGLFGVGVGAWVQVQRGYLTLLPPTHFAFLKTLAEPPYVGQSFVGNRYMAAPAVYTGQWAYIDATIGQARIELTDNGYRVAQELQTYVWLYDRATNPEYREPRYYLCTRFQSLADALVRAQGRESVDGSCNDLPIVRRADSPDQPFLQYRVVGRDPSPFGAWAIVELDWEFPPYLQPLPGAGPARVTATPRQTAAGAVLDVGYQYAHQKGQPEAGTLMRLYRQDAAGARELLREQSDPSPLSLPANLTGPFVVSVQPGTAAKRGPEYFSEPITVGTAAGGRP